MMAGNSFFKKWWNIYDSRVLSYFYQIIILIVSARQTLPVTTEVPLGNRVLGTYYLINDTSV